jgi:hypothetical protein
VDEFGLCARDIRPGTVLTVIKYPHTLVKKTYY